MFNALLIDKVEGQYDCRLAEVDDTRLPEGDVTVRVEYSAVNYKDALAVTGKSPVVRTFPMIPGIDFAGVVERSRRADFAVGDRVLLNGWGTGETHWGGLAERARVRGEWLIALPEGLSARQVMALGTAGYTAMLAVQRLHQLGVTPDKGDIIVTGAGGGVGGVAIQLLAQRGYRVVASTGRLDETPYLQSLGAAEVIDRASLASAGKPLLKERWAGGIDSVGSHTLANLCAGTRYGGVIAACGLAQGLDFPASVAPFILRGVTLAGIDSVYRPIADRLAAWTALSAEINHELLDRMTREIGLAEVPEVAAALLAGHVRGRTVVRL